jgi:hypothetical protein
MVERQEGGKQVGDKPLPKARQVADHRAHLLKQWATPKAKLLHKTEKQTVNPHNTLTAEGLMEH